MLEYWNNGLTKVEWLSSRVVKWFRSKRALHYTTQQLNDLTTQLTIHFICANYRMAPKLPPQGSDDLIRIGVPFPGAEPPQ